MGWDGAYRIRRLPGGSPARLRFETADGRPIGAPGPCLDPGLDPELRGAAYLRERHREQGRQIDAWTAWALDGSRCSDRRYVVDVMIDASDYAAAHSPGGTGGPAP